MTNRALNTHLLLCLATALWIWPSRVAAKYGVLTSDKLRVIVLTDIGDAGSEPDDNESLVRLMLYSNEIDIEAIITTPSWCMPAVDQSHYDRIVKVVRAYGQVRDNLLVHAAGYPTLEYLLDRVKHGTPRQNMTNVGTGKSNEGSAFIISVVDRPDDPRPVWVSAWTGLTTLAQALYDVRATRTPEQVQAFARKLRVYDIDGQDDCGAWIMKNFPSIKVLRSDWQFYGMSDTPGNAFTECGDLSVVSHRWLAEHVRSQGPLGAVYPDFKYGMETDSPALLYMIPNGLNDPDEQNWGGWGGRFTADPVLNPPVCDWAGVIDEGANKPFYGYRDEVDTWSDPAKNKYEVNNPFAAVARWRVAFQNEMAARMLWSVNPTYAACNHSPIVMLNGDTTRNILTINASPGQTVHLTAAGTKDPDADSLRYHWYVYPEPGTFRGAVAMTGAASPAVLITLPADDLNGTIHVILEVQDNGKGFPLTTYRRVILRTGNGGFNAGKVATLNDDQIGTGDNQFDYVGHWVYAKGQFRCHQDDNHLSSTRGDHVEVKFNGTQIKLYGMINPGQGTADVQIDGGTANTVNFVGPCAEGDVLLFTSAILPAGEHTLTATVNGTGNVRVDHVDVVGGG